MVYSANVMRALMGIKKATPFIMILLILFIGFWSVVYSSVTYHPGSLQKTKIPRPVYSIMLIMGFPDEWLFFPAIIYVGLIPVLILSVSIYGVLNDIVKLFNQNLNMILGFLITVTIIPMGLFTRMVSFVLSTWTMLWFGIMASILFLNVIIHFWGRMSGFGFMEELEDNLNKDKLAVQYTQLLVEAGDMIKAAQAIGNPQVAALAVRAEGKLNAAYNTKILYNTSNNISDLKRAISLLNEAKQVLG